MRLKIGAALVAALLVVGAVPRPRPRNGGAARHPSGRDALDGAGDGVRYLH